MKIGDQSQISHIPEENGNNHDNTLERINNIKEILDQVDSGIFQSLGLMEDLNSFGKNFK